ncbi:MAG TPA: zinc ribbon domain-containing protein [Streptosporangiaceae bacterium]|nr:zinc ribbon domain-containing protein [Streptosporangiaceae bacterium]
MKPDLRFELLRRAERDQAARGKGEPDWESVVAVDAENLAWLMRVVAEVGWPGRSMVGEDGAHAAWLLAQHADRDPAFQRRCLDLLTEATDRDEASSAELAYLTDRVLLAESQPQEYGTQFTGREGRWAPRRLRDPENLDERRAAMSLGPLADNIARLDEAYGPPRPGSVPCAKCGGTVEVWLPDEGEERKVNCPACGWTATLRVGAPARATRRPDGPLAGH